MLEGKGKIYYGMHFYPGVAEYAEPNSKPYRIFINENTIRKMDPSFAGRPVFVEHVDEVDSDVNELRKDADGWVIESFFNTADGKHWVKFIVVTDKADRAIKNGFRLSNAYIPQGAYGPSGLWNGVEYQNEVLNGEYEHLAIVRNPRYEESVIMTPEEFKQYNENAQLELKKLANSKDKGVKEMGLKFFKRAKVENAADIEGVSVTLPKSGKDVTIAEAVELADKFENMQGYANGDHMVKVGENEMTVNDLVKSHMDCQNKLAEMEKAKNESESEIDMEQEEVDVEGDLHNDEDADKEAKKKALQLAEHEEEEIEEAKKENEDDEKADKEKDAEKKKNALAAKKKKNFDALKNAHKHAIEEVAVVDLSEDRVARGKARYGS